LRDIKVIDVDAHVSDHFRSYVRVMLLDIPDPLVRSIRFSAAVRQQQNRSSRRKSICHIPPISRVVGFVGSLWIPRHVVDLMEVTLRIRGDKVLGQFSVRRIGGVDRGLAKFYDRNDAFPL
jgi:hypothetical protein